MGPITPKEIRLDRDALRSRTLEMFAQGYNCAEALVAAFAAELDACPTVMRLATPFGAGIGGRRDLCGILTGGTLIIGLVSGRTEPSDSERKKLAYKQGADYYRWFKTEHKLRCSEIVTGKFTGHTADCVALMDQAQAKLAEIVGDRQ
jgi:C_GCAxxG_C_C family probable redox protein